MSHSHVDKLLSLFDERAHELRIFMHGVEAYIGEHPSLNVSGREVIHSTKSRMKDREHLREKIARKMKSNHIITPENFFEKITDLAGVRALLIFQEDFEAVDNVVRKRVANGDWHLGERARAYTWDPEAVEFFNKFDLEVSKKETFYTSVHYLVRPRMDSPICCELQVRTLFEEIWGEVDHRMNYPRPSQDIACREQLKVLAKITGAGSRLLDALRRTSPDRRAATDGDGPIGG